MPFKRTWDAECPRVWEQWKVNDQQWVLQDLDPRDDEEALDILLGILGADEMLCLVSRVQEDEESLINMRKFWKECLAQRMSLALYTWEGDKKILAAVNVCVVASVGETVPDIEINGAKWKNVFAALDYVERKRDPHKYLGLDTLLHAFGLVVKREYRGSKLGAKLLAAREPLCKFYGVKGTTTVFTGPASQKLAAKCGFETIAEATLKEMFEHGLDFPPDTNRCIKLMVKKFD
ncbi:uncharacterized protein LOC119830457 isoform X2 [Zerene cesonia]|uniref:uncharacterized protein LOC119830457 isoform X2 n=1 Tax=Zerene cesonia TaxID=33412 RepID=UPI0018E5927D|nr:uncharacterized protein LOC119830457 isoform X2 [Zerene cesonia]